MMKIVKIKKLVEKVVELKPYRGGLRITAGKRKNPKPLENKGFWALVRVFITDLT